MYVCVQEDEMQFCFKSAFNEIGFVESDPYVHTKIPAPLQRTIVNGANLMATLMGQSTNLMRDLYIVMTCIAFLLSTYSSNLFQVFLANDVASKLRSTARLMKRKVVSYESIF